MKVNGVIFRLRLQLQQIKCKNFKEILLKQRFYSKRDMIKNSTQMEVVENILTRLIKPYDNSYKHQLISLSY